MGWDGNGNFDRDNGTYTGNNVWQQDEAAGTKIVSTNHDTHDQDLADGIEACLAKNGENAMTGDLDMGGNTIINYGSGNITVQAPASGTFTPTIYDSTATGTFSYSAQTGYYIVIDDLVWVWIYITGSWSVSPSGKIYIGGLPFAPDVSKLITLKNTTHVNFVSDSDILATTGLSRLELHKYTTNGYYTNITDADQVSNFHQLNINGNYIKV